jgi:CRP/FNR family transcriptional regulator, cyclic AMP receptor protein
MSVTSVDSLFLRVIREVELFKQLGRDDLSMLLRQASKASFSAGEVIYEEGSEGQCMYVVVQGRFEVYRHANGGRMHLADVLPGEHFGEIALLGNGVRSASVVAVADSVALRLQRQALFERPQIAVQLLRNMGKMLASRLTDADDEIILHRTKALQAEAEARVQAERGATPSNRKGSQRRYFG